MENYETISARAAWGELVVGLPLTPAGTDSPTSGSVRWDGALAGSLPERERARLRLSGVGFIFQRFHLLPTLTAAENVELPLRAARRPGPERSARVAELLERVGLTGRAAAYPHELSGGEEQRAAVARALANGPGLLLADEPTGELDRANAQAVLDLLVEAHRETGAALVIVTHNPDVAARASRHVTMRDGRILTDSLAE
ncbi:MAG: ABC transporter ATP-binding protein [Thermoplasmata archaeon]|nr:ABC transporter ATP-binding protein [Thermoplasmata archaeon]